MEETQTYQWGREISRNPKKNGFGVGGEGSFLYQAFLVVVSSAQLTTCRKSGSFEVTATCMLFIGYLLFSSRNFFIARKNTWRAHVTFAPSRKPTFDFRRSPLLDLVGCKSSGSGQILTLFVNRVYGWNHGSQGQRRFGIKFATHSSLGFERARLWVIKPIVMFCKEKNKFPSLYLKLTIA